MRFLLAGASGFLGTALRVRLAERGHEVRRLVRSAAIDSTEFYWEPMSGRINARALDGVDVIINLAGPPVFARPWTASRREYLRESRIESTRLLAETIVERHTDTETKPLWVQTSATGWYGTSTELLDQPYDETAPAADDFLGQLAHDWEGATAHAAGAGVPLIFTRNAMVLDHSGSTLKLVKPVFGLGLGAALGNGRQRMAVISLHDWLRAVEFLVDLGRPGAYNLSLPQPPTNSDFTNTLARLLGRKARLAAPGKVLRTALGELAEQLVADQYVVPRALLDLGFTFDGPDIESALRLALGRERQPGQA